MPTMKTAYTIANAVLLCAILVLLHGFPAAPVRGREDVFDKAPHEFQRGDANDDGSLDLSDASFTLNYLFLGDDEPECLAAADANDDGRLDISDPILVLHFLFRGGREPVPPFTVPGIDPTPDLGCREAALPPLLPVGSAGGPDRELTPEEALSWRRGFQLFDRPTAIHQGLGPTFNADSCRGCHIDPAVGGAGGLDLDVLRFAHVDEGGNLTQLAGGPAASRLALPTVLREECPGGTNVMERRQTPSALGLGLVDRIPDSVLLENADADDADADGISGRARMVGGRVGRFGHKCGVPTLRDFCADALFNELGLTVDGSLTSFATASDTDAVADPELAEQGFLDMVFFVSHLAPPARELPANPAALQRIEEGERLFHATGCDRCHVPSLSGSDGPVPAYSDFLLHDVADPGRRQVDEPDVAPREFRTAPLWGLRNTGPYLHDGSAETIRAAVTTGHFGEATAVRAAFEALSSDEKVMVVEMLMSL
jgi:hypothetical protein